MVHGVPCIGSDVVWVGGLAIEQTCANRERR